MRRAAWVGLVLAAGCIGDKRATRDRSAGLWDNVPEVQAPEKDRCANQGHNAMRTRCNEARYLGELYVRKLSSGDEVCLEGGFGDAPGGACLARAKVDDVDSHRVLIEIREAKPDSRWFRKEGNQVWYFEGALVDLYLADHGY